MSKPLQPRRQKRRLLPPQSPSRRLSSRPPRRLHRSPSQHRSRSIIRWPKRSPARLRRQPHPQPQPQSSPPRSNHWPRRSTFRRELSRGRRSPAQVESQVAAPKWRNHVRRLPVKTCPQRAKRRGRLPMWQAPPSLRSRSVGARSRRLPVVRCRPPPVARFRLLLARPDRGAQQPDPAVPAVPAEVPAVVPAAIRVAQVAVPVAALVPATAVARVAPAVVLAVQVEVPAVQVPTVVRAVNVAHRIAASVVVVVTVTSCSPRSRTTRHATPPSRWARSSSSAAYRLRNSAPR
jgi:hypothetical protein